MARRQGWARAAALVCVLGLSACARIIPEGSAPATGAPPPVAIPAPSPAPTADPVPVVVRAVTPGPDVSSLAFDEQDAREALAAFLESCPKVVAREDCTGLTTRSDWAGVCDTARGWSRTDARRFFLTQFDAVQISDGQAFATGYFEPEIAGSRTRRPGYDVPVYRMPPDLVRGWTADVPQAERTGRAPLGRYAADGSFVRYYERSEIEAGALAGRGLELAWAADPVEFFFLQIQGSGLLRLPDNTQMRIGYAGQNGREYVGIGRVMRERGMIGEGTPYPTSMQGIIAYIRDNPVQGAEVMNLNKSWIFFRELTTDGPLGALEVPVRGRSSVAADPAYTPLGAPVWLDLDRNEADGLWIAQDTGGAIKGANRFDTFWGNGAEARRIAGGMSASGRAYVLLPKSAAARLER